MDDLVEVAVEPNAAAPAFEVPSGWRYDTYAVNSLEVQVLTPPREAASSRAPIVSFHDVGMNAPLCFSSFFSYCRTTGTCPELDTVLAHYHITAPGHFAHSSGALGGAKPSYELADLAAGVLAVLDRFGLRRAIGFGFGFGGSILMHAALVAPRRFSGLVLVSPVVYAASLWERTFTSADVITTQGLGLGRRAKERFLERWISPSARDHNHDLIAHIEDELDRLPSANLAAFLSAEARRPDLSERVKDLRPKTLLVTGRDSPLRYHVDDAFSSFEPARVTWLDVMDMGSFVHEEAPERVAKAVSLFLQGFGSYE